MTRKCRDCAAPIPERRPVSCCPDCLKVRSAALHAVARERSRVIGHGTDRRGRPTVVRSTGVCEALFRAATERLADEGVAAKARNLRRIRDARAKLNAERRKTVDRVLAQARRLRSSPLHRTRKARAEAIAELLAEKPSKVYWILVKHHA